MFTGPTIGVEEARAELDAIYLPPVAQGDVYRVSLEHPRAIGIIDGYFERVPAVWHKEILWAMAEGIHVFGSASMGALRAAELAPFGMEGVGAVFEAYRDGWLEADDEVAVVHGPADVGYRAMSEAMVNIRRTLADAEAARVMSAATRAALEQIAKDLHYPERSYPRLLRRGAELQLPGVELEAFRDWLPGGRVDQKRADALAMLQLMRARLAPDPGPKRVDYAVERTDVWEQARWVAGALPVGEPGEESISLDRLLDELRLERDAYGGVFHATLARLLAIGETRRQGLVISPQLLADVTDTFRREHRLSAPADLARWQAAHHVTPEGFMRLMEDEARLRWVETLARSEIVRLLPDHLRVSGAYRRLVARARDKQHVLERRGLRHPRLADTGLSERELLRWYLEDRLGYPPGTDPAAYAHAVGFADADAFRYAVLREYCYTRQAEMPPRDPPKPTDTG